MLINLKPLYKIKWIEHLFISVLILLAIILLKQKPSVWGDEYLGGLDYINVSSFSIYYSYILSYGPQVPPSHFLIQYLLCGKLGMSIETFRWVVIFFNLITVNSLYLIAKHFLPRKYAIGVVALFILSPILLWNSASLRYHSIAYMLAMLSLYFFFKYFITPQKICGYAVIIQTGINILLVLSHSIFVWLIGFEIFLLTLKVLKRQYIYLVPAFLNLIIFGITLLYLAYILRGNKFLALPFQPILLETFEKIFGIRDLEIPVYVSWGVFLQPFFVPYPIPPLIQKICDVAPTVITKVGGLTLAFVLFLSFIYTSYQIIKNYRSFSESFIAIFILAFIPPLVFACYSFVANTDLLLVRYVLPCYIAKLCFLFIILYKWNPKNNFYKQIIIGLIVFWALHQYSLFRVNKIYTDWEGCVQYVNSNLTENDVVICNTDIDTAIFKYNWKARIQKSFPLIFTSDSLDTATDFITFLIKNLPPSKKIFFIYNTKWNYQFESTINHFWNKHGLQYTFCGFPSWEGLLCYIFSVDENLKVENNNTGELKESSMQPSDDLLISLLKSNLNREFDEQEKRILSRYENFGAELGLTTPIHLTLNLLSVDKKEWATIITKHFQHLNAWVAFSYALSEQEDIQKADEIFQQIKKQNPYFFNIFLPIWKAFKTKDYRSLKEDSLRLIKDGYFPAYLFYHFATHKVDNTPCILPLGIYPFTMDSEDKLRNILLKEPNISNNKIIEDRYEEIIQLRNICTKS